MDWRFIAEWWQDWQESLSRAERERQDAEFSRMRRADAEDKRRREEREQDDEFVTFLLLSEENNRRRELQQDINDAIKAAQHAYQRALRAAEAAQSSLEEARRRALVLPDGRRVYFASDGRLYGEDGGEIEDTGELEAVRRAGLKPGATSYESYIEKVGEADETNARLERIGESLQQLRDLKERVEAGNISPRELADARRELEETIRSMSPEAREEYERLRFARIDDAPKVDTPITAPRILQADFARANRSFGMVSLKTAQADSLPLQPTEDDSVADCRPAYKPAPDF